MRLVSVRLCYNQRSYYNKVNTLSISRLSCNFWITKQTQAYCTTRLGHNLNVLATCRPNSELLPFKIWPVADVVGLSFKNFILCAHIQSLTKFLQAASIVFVCNSWSIICFLDSFINNECINSAYGTSRIKETKKSFGTYFLVHLMNYYCSMKSNSRCGPRPPCALYNQ